MKKFFRATALAVVAALALGTASACATVSAPDQIGLYYKLGPMDGNHFDHCFGSDTNYTWNNEVFYLPANLRTWNIAPDSTDSTAPIVVNAKPEENQPSGVQVSLWTQTNFTLNTDCGADMKDPNSPIVRWWDTIGRRYQANTDEGWKRMLQNTIVTALETSSRSVARDYTADVLVSNIQREEIQQRISTLFQGEIKRLVGGEYFCSPTYSPGGECGEVQVLLKDVDYTNASIQAARDEKQAAIERAAAAVAEAEGKVQAAEAVGDLYNNPAWIELELAKTKLAQVQACAASASCTIVIGSDGGVIVGSR